MPINYEQLADDQQREFSDYLTRERGLTDSVISSTGRNLENSQNDFFTSALANLPQNEVQAALSQKSPILNIQRQGILNNQKFDRDRIILNQLGSQAFDLARRRGLGIAASQDFARRYINQVNEQKYLESENIANREFSEDKLNMDLDFARKKSKMAEAVGEQSPYSILGPLFESGSAIATSYFMRPKKETVSTPINQTSLNQYNSAMNRRYYGR